MNSHQLFSNYDENKGKQKISGSMSMCLPFESLSPKTKVILCLFQRTNL